MAEFLSKATGTAVDWVQMPGMKVCYLPLLECYLYVSCYKGLFICKEFHVDVYCQPGPDSVGIFAISQSGVGVAARACGLVSLEPTKVCHLFIAGDKILFDGYAVLGQLNLLNSLNFDSLYPKNIGRLWRS